jgi:hypothetical protein
MDDRVYMVTASAGDVVVGGAGNDDRGMAAGLMARTVNGRNSAVEVEVEVAGSLLLLP